MRTAKEVYQGLLDIKQLIADVDCTIEKLDAEAYKQKLARIEYLESWRREILAEAAERADDFAVLMLTKDIHRDSLRRAVMGEEV